MNRRFHSLRWKILIALILNSAFSVIVLLVTIGWISRIFGDSLSWDLFNGSLVLNPLVWIAALSGVVLSSLPFGFYVTQGLRRKIQTLSDSAVFWSNGKYDHRVNLPGDDEFAQIASQWNRMADRMESQIDTLQNLLQKNKELADRSRKLAVVEERQLLARELHDSVSQQLFAISMISAALARKAKREQLSIHPPLQNLNTMAVEAQTEMRALLLHLRPAGLEDRDLKPALEHLLQELSEKHSIRYRWQVDDLPPLGKGVEEHLFRIVQEGLSNVLRHSQASQVHLTLKTFTHSLLLSIEDNGVGFSDEKKRKSSYGLSHMEERAREMGGTFKILSVEGKGTRLEVIIPIKKEEKELAHPNPDRRRP